MKLLEGPMTPTRLARELRKNDSLGTYWKRSFVRDGLAQVTGKGLMLTEKGTRQASQWSYQLKNLNNHPDQLEAKVLVEKRQDLDRAIDRHLELAGGGAVDDTIHVVGTIDWQQRHIDYLEELCMELAKRT